MKKLKLELPYDPVIPLLDMHVEMMKTLNSKRYMYPSIHSSTFTMAKAWKQPKCPSTDEWIKICYTHRHTHIHRHTHSGILLNHKKEWTNAICTNMDGLGNYHTVNYMRQIFYDIAYIWNLKKWYKWTYIQNTNRLTDIENKLIVTNREVGVKDKLGVWD